mmetsp:Transcript_32963/g.64681  ORF Transcript_32963/g.64681 Transcript_32963/m.64681 type:complete len:592 (+) Transcript_32963:16-1791(+)
MERGLFEDERVSEEDDNDEPDGPLGYGRGHVFQPAPRPASVWGVVKRAKEFERGMQGKDSGRVRPKTARNQRTSGFHSGSSIRTQSRPVSRPHSVRSEYNGFPVRGYSEAPPSFGPADADTTQSPRCKTLSSAQRPASSSHSKTKNSRKVSSAFANRRRRPQTSRPTTTTLNFRDRSLLLSKLMGPRYRFFESLPGDPNLNVNNLIKYLLLASGSLDNCLACLEHLSSEECKFDSFAELVVCVTKYFYKPVTPELTKLVEVSAKHAGVNPNRRKPAYGQIVKNPWDMYKSETSRKFGEEENSESLDLYRMSAPSSFSQSCKNDQKKWMTKFEDRSKFRREASQKGSPRVPDTFAPKFDSQETTDESTLPDAPPNHQSVPPTNSNPNSTNNSLSPRHSFAPSKHTHATTNSAPTHGKLSMEAVAPALAQLSKKEMKRALLLYLTSDCSLFSQAKGLLLLHNDHLNMLLELFDCDVSQLLVQLQFLDASGKKFFSFVDLYDYLDNHDEAYDRKVFADTRFLYLRYLRSWEAAQASNGPLASLVPLGPRPQFTPRDLERRTSGSENEDENKTGNAFADTVIQAVIQTNADFMYS